MLPKQTVSSQAVRHMLPAILPTDSDFSAFCEDYFPDTARRFSDGMDRVAKASLLLKYADPQSIFTALKEYSPQRMTQHGWDLNAPQKNPYRGLAAFQQDEAHLFFGREALTDELWQRFVALCTKPDATRLFAILGPSGSGKSSVARAGLLAKLVRVPVPGSESMRLAIVKPGERPIESLARALVSLLPADIAVLSASRQIAIENLLRDKEVFAQGLRRFAADLPNIFVSQLVVFIDQFEELYTLCKDSTERDLFVELLQHAASDSGGQVSIILTLRSDFLGETQRQHPELNRLIGAQHELVSAMSADELRDAIAKPAALAGRSIDPTTVELLLAEARGSQGALPLLEFALTRIWEGMEFGAEPGTTLRSLGGVGGALAGEARKIYQALSTPEQATARRALVRMVRLGEGTRDTRRRVPLAELCGQGESEAVVLSVLRKFATENARLVTLGGEGAETLAEVTHEALFEHWTELRTWIEQSRKDRGLHDRALEAAKLWSQDGKPAGRLWRPPDLDLLRDYQRRKPEEFGPSLAAFLIAAERRRKREQLLSVGTTAAIFTMILIATGNYVRQERQRAKAVRDGLLVTVAQSLKDDPTVEALVLREGGEQNSSLWTQLAIDALQARPAEVVLRDHNSYVTSVAWSPDGKSVFTGSVDTNLRRFAADGSGHAAVINSHEGSIDALAMSPDGTRIAMGYGGEASILKTDGSGRLLTLDGHERLINAIAWSPDGTKIVTGSDDKSISVWDASQSKALFTIKEHEGAVKGVAFSPDGKQIVSGSADKTVRIFSADGSSSHSALLNPSVDASELADVMRVGWSARGIFAGYGDGTIRIFDASNSGKPILLRGSDNVTAAAFSPDGNLLVVGFTGEVLQDVACIWDLRAPQKKPTCLKWHQLSGTGVNAAAFSPDGAKVMVASDQVVRIFPVGEPAVSTVFKLHGASIASVAFSADGQKIAVGLHNKTMHTLNADGSGSAVIDSVRETLASTKVSRFKGKVATIVDYKISIRSDDSAKNGVMLESDAAPFTSIAWSYDGSKIAAGDKHNKVYIFNSDGSGTPIVLRGHKDIVNAVAWSRDGSKVISGSQDGTARIWTVGVEALRAKLWEASTDCLPVARRRELLLESPADAEAGYESCRKEVAQRHGWATR